MNEKEKNADMVVYGITCRLGKEENIEFRYNVKTEEIEYDKEFANEWKIVTDIFLGGIRDFLLFDGDVFQVEDLRELFKLAPSIRYEPKN